MSVAVAVTGLGAITPVGNSAQSSFDAIIKGESGIATITQMDTTGFSVHIGGEVKGFEPTSVVEKREVGKIDRFSLLALAAAVEAVSDAGLNLNDYSAERVGVAIGTGIGGLHTIEENYRNFMEKGPRRISPFTVPKMMSNAAAGQVSIKFGFKGPNFCVVTACASANHSIGEAYRLISEGHADAMVAGGSEACFCALGLGGFASAKALSRRNDDPKRASRPFEKNRDGFVLAEGAGLLILENLEMAKKRGAKIYATLDGYGATGDAYHITAPASDGSGGIAGMRGAIENAGWNVSEVDYINAHGTSTAMNDKIETQVIKEVFGDYAKSVSVSSTKSSTGHTLGAAGGIEAVFSILAMEHSVIPPTINYEEPDPDLDLDYTPNQPKEKKVSRILSNSLGFGGHNSTLAFTKFE